MALQTDLPQHRHHRKETTSFFLGQAPKTQLLVSQVLSPLPVPTTKWHQLYVLWNIIFASLDDQGFALRICEKCSSKQHRSPTPQQFLSPWQTEFYGDQITFAGSSFATFLFVSANKSAPPSPKSDTPPTGFLLPLQEGEKMLQVGGGVFSNQGKCIPTFSGEVDTGLSCSIYIGKKRSNQPEKWLVHPWNGCRTHKFVFR